MRAGWGIPWANYSLEDVLEKGDNGVYDARWIHDMLYEMKHIMSGDQLMRFGDLTGDTQAFTLGVLRRELEGEEENDACDHEEDNLIKENTEG